MQLCTYKLPLNLDISKSNTSKSETVIRVAKDVADDRRNIAAEFTH